jgi:TonB family protein
MTAIEQRFRRNFILACILHGALVIGIVVFEGFISNARSSAPTAVELITPADILGDLPKGAGLGRGNYAPPPPSESSVQNPAEATGPNNATLSADEQLAPKAKVAAPQVNDPNEILIPKKPTPTTTKKPVPTEKATTTTVTAKTASTATKKTSAKPAVSAKSSTKTTAAGPAVSANSIRQRFASALTAAEGGTPGGDNRAPGGGTGESKYGRLGSPDGAADGIAGGIGKGSQFWSYYLQVHDRMYEAWEQPGQAVSYDKKLVATILLRVARDGRILDARLQNSSGNKLMDDSALLAAHEVPRLNPLPQGLGGDTADISVNFRLEG